MENSIKLTKKQTALIQSLKKMNEAYYLFSEYLDEVEEETNAQTRGVLHEQYEEFFQPCYNYVHKELQTANDEVLNTYLFENA